MKISIVVSESTFSTRDRLWSPHYSKFHEKTLEALICGQSRLKHKQEGNKHYIILFTQLEFFLSSIGNFNYYFQIINS